MAAPCRRLVGALLLALAAHAPASPADRHTRYLAFQVFTDGFALFGGSSAQPVAATRAEVAGWVRDLKERIGTSGDRDRKLAFVVGPLVLDYTDAELRRVIADGFAVALEHDVAVGFHIDDSLFWGRRGAIAGYPGNMEWLDWSGTPNTGRRIDWDVAPTKLYPHLCYNSAGVRAEIARVGSQVIGTAIREGVELLARRHRGELFAGVIVGWETQLGRDFDTGRALGYCALSNKGFSADHLPADADGERVAIVREFIQLWAWSISASGVRNSKLYAHIAFLTRTSYERDGQPTAKSYLEATNFSPPEVAVETSLRPGFTTYPAAGLYPELYALLAARPRLPWASSEGTNVVPPGFAGEVSMETYLARMFNHGAALVNLFGWGLGGEPGVGNPFRKETEAPSSIAAYRRFLAGARRKSRASVRCCRYGSRREAKRRSSLRCCSSSTPASAPTTCSPRTPWPIAFSP